MTDHGKIGVVPKTDKQQEQDRHIFKVLQTFVGKIVKKILADLFTAGEVGWCIDGWLECFLWFVLEYEYQGLKDTS